MRTLKSGGDLFNLATRLFRTEIDRRAYATPAPMLVPVACFGVQGLVVLCPDSSMFVVIQFDQNGIRCAWRRGRTYAVGRGHAVAAGLNRQFNNVLGQVARIWPQRRRRVLLLIDERYRHPVPPGVQ